MALLVATKTQSADPRQMEKTSLLVNALPITKLMLTVSVMIPQLTSQVEALPPSTVSPLHLWH